MWTEQHRKIYQPVERRYPRDMTNSEWAYLEPLIPRAELGGRPRETNMREAINAILYVLRTGCPWRCLPREGCDYIRARSVCLNSRLAAAKWISAMVMLQPGLAASQ